MPETMEQHANRLAHADRILREGIAALSRDGEPLHPQGVMTEKETALRDAHRATFENARNAAQMELDAVSNERAVLVAKESLPVASLSHGDLTRASALRSFIDADVERLPLAISILAAKNAIDDNDRALTALYLRALVQRGSREDPVDLGSELEDVLASARTFLFQHDTKHAQLNAREEAANALAMKVATASFISRNYGSVPDEESVRQRYTASRP